MEVIWSMRNFDDGRNKNHTLNPGVGRFALLKASNCKVDESTVELDNFVGKIVGVE